ncbi:NAD-dependent epimerase/dehydratase family protein, partial [Staphylococcus capitis]
MILVTGGAGYIGSHTLHRLKDLGQAAVALDNLSSGHRWAVPKGTDLVEG